MRYGVRPGIKVFMVLALCSCLLGCSMLVQSQQQLTVTASENDADIFVNGRHIGQGTATVMVPRNKSASIMVKKDGFNPAEKTIGYGLATVGVVDLVGGVICLVPLVGLLAPGAQELRQDNVAIPLEPAGQVQGSIIMPAPIEVPAPAPVLSEPTPQ
jgi:hypothetical protein